MEHTHNLEHLALLNPETKYSIDQLLPQEQKKNVYPEAIVEAYNPTEEEIIELNVKKGKNARLIFDGSSKWIESETLAI
jgi:hypothetical protein